MCVWERVRVCDWVRERVCVWERLREWAKWNLRCDRSDFESQSCQCSWSLYRSGRKSFLWVLRLSHSLSLTFSLQLPLSFLPLSFLIICKSAFSSIPNPLEVFWSQESLPEKKNCRITLNKNFRNLFWSLRPPRLKIMAELYDRLMRDGPGREWERGERERDHEKEEESSRDSYLTHWGDTNKWSTLFFFRISWISWEPFRPDGTRFEAFRYRCREFRMKKLFPNSETENDDSAVLSIKVTLVFVCGLPRSILYLLPSARMRPHAAFKTFNER